MGVLLGGAFRVAVIVFRKAKGRWCGTGGGRRGELDGFIEKRDLVHRPGTLRCS